MKKLNLAIIGQGRSGRDIHGAFFKSEKNVWFNVKYVVEADPERRERALSEYEGCEVLSDYTELFSKTDVDMVVNASYSDMHYPITKDLLKHGFNVTVEKPFARNYYECMDLIETAKRHGAVLSIFQQTFFAPFYEKALEVAKSGIIGEVKEVNLRYNGLSRRWDWQTLQERLGGSLYNTGPHPVGMALGFLDFAPDTRVAYSKLDLALTSGDAEDFVKIILTAKDKPVIDLEINATDAYTDYNVKLQGTRGTFKATPGKYKMKYIVEGENPERPVIFASLKGANGEPIYCSEKLIAHEEEGTFSGTAFDVGTRKYYEMVYARLTENKPLALDPYDMAKIVKVMETVHAENPLPIKYTEEDNV